MNEVYRVVTRWDGRLWRVRVEDEHGSHRGDTTARRLEQIEARARAVVSEGGGGGGYADAVDVAVEVQLHPQVEQRFRAAEDLCRDASREADDIVAGLRQLNMSAQDIVTLLRGRPLRAEPSRPLVVSNAEIAACGLDCRPDVVAVQWEDRGFGLTTYCRDCVEEDRSAWADLPHGTSALFYEGPMRCDVFDRDIDAAPETVRQMAADGGAGWGSIQPTGSTAHESGAPTPAPSTEHGLRPPSHIEDIG